MSETPHKHSATATRHARVSTERAARYIKQFFGHWGRHTSRVDSAGTSTVMLFEEDAQFDSYTITFAANHNTLNMQVQSASPVTVGAITTAVTEHLARFARRENLVVTWRDNTVGEPVESEPKTREEGPER